MWVSATLRLVTVVVALAGSSGARIQAPAGLVRLTLELRSVSCEPSGSADVTARLQLRMRVTNQSPGRVIFFVAAPVGRLELARTVADLRARRLKQEIDYDEVHPDLSRLDTRSPEFATLPSGASIVLDRTAPILLSRTEGMPTDGNYVLSVWLRTWPASTEVGEAFQERNRFAGTLFPDEFLRSEPEEVSIACGVRQWARRRGPALEAPAPTRTEAPRT